MLPDKSTPENATNRNRLVPAYDVERLLPARQPAVLQHHQAGNEADLHFYLSVASRRRWLIATVVLVLTLSVALYEFSLQNIYQTTALLRFQPHNVPLQEDKMSSSVFDLYQYIDTQLELLRNDHLIRRAVLKHQLYANPNLLDDELSDWKAPFRKLFISKHKALPQPRPDLFPTANPEDSENLTQDQISFLAPYVASIQQRMAVQQQTGTSLVTVSFKHTDPDVAASVVAAVTDTFISDNIKFENAGVRSELELLGKQIAEIQTNIQGFEQQRLKFLRENNLPLSEGQGRNLVGERVASLSSQLLATEEERKRLEAELESARTTSDIWSIPQVAASKGVQESRTQLRLLKEKREELLQVYTPEWPEVQKVEAQIKQLNQEVEDSAREVIAGIKTGYDAALARESKLRSAYESENDAANGQSRNSMEVQSLDQKIEMSRQLYSTLFQDQKKLEISSIDQGNSVSLVAPAVRPDDPISNSRWTKIGLAFVFSLAIGAVFALVRERFDSNLTTVDDVTTHLSLQTLGVIPAHRRKLQLTTGRHASKNESALRLMDDSFSPTAEAYRNLRTSLLFAAHDHEPQMILITSSQQLEGKTATTVNLACAFAQAGQEVLIIDCDLRRPRVHRHFNLPNETGVTNYLAGTADLESLLRTPLKYPLMKILTAGSMLANPSDCLDSAEMRTLLEEMRKRFAYIIIDSPPALPFADAPLLSTMVDATLIVVNSRRTNRRKVSRVKERLNELGSPIFGVVLNYTGRESNDSYYYYYRKEECEPADEADENS